MEICSRAHVDLYFLYPRCTFNVKYEGIFVYIHICVIPKRDILIYWNEKIDLSIYVKFLHFRIFLLVITSELFVCFFFSFSFRDYGIQFTTIRKKSHKQIILSFQKSILKMSICAFIQMIVPVSAQFFESDVSNVLFWSTYNNVQ